MCTVSVRAGSVHCLSEGGECALSTVRAGSVHCLSEGGECALSQ